jgi:hypothetical protein
VIQPKGTTGITTAMWNGTVPSQQSMYQQQMNAVVNEELNKALRNVLIGTSP